MSDDLTDEATYERVRLRQWLQLSPLTRRRLLGASAGAGLAMAALPALPARAEGPIVKPLPPELFIDHGTNAEMRWEAMRGQGHLTPADRFFVRNHTATPRIDPRTWRLKVWGSGLRGRPTLENAVEFSYADLKAMPSKTVTAVIECTGNGRSLFTTQQGQPVSGTPWKLGAAGAARWRGVPLAEVLRRAGITPHAVDVMPRGLDADYIDKGENKGRVRRPLPVAKALKDVLLAYEMNGRPLPPDHGFPVRVMVPSWVGIASIKWVGDIEVSDQPLFSPWNTVYYRLFGDSYPPEGSAPLTRLSLKSVFELPWDGQVPVRDAKVLHGRSWSGNGRIRKVEVSVDGGATWHKAQLHGPHAPESWVQWRYQWRNPRPGSYELLARATDETGATQPAVTPHNTLGYLFDAVARHPVTLV